MNSISEVLHSDHIRSNFNCGNDILNRYLNELAGQDMKRKLSVCFVWTDSSNHVLGYYTLSSTSIQRSSLPEKMMKKIPKTYSEIPVTLIGRFAVDQSIQGKGNGMLLLMDALQRAYSLTENKIGSIAVVANPITRDATRFYAKCGFIPLESTLRMLIPMKTIKSVI